MARRGPSRAATIVRVTVGTLLAAGLTTSCATDHAQVRVIPTTTTGVVVAPGFTLVDGATTSLRLAPAGLDQEHLGPSIHIDLLVRGAANASLAGVTIDGNPATIAWPGGTPLDFTGPAGSTLPTPLAVDGDASGLLVHLDAGVLRLVPGRWHLTGSVAVGQRGLAKAMDGVDFTVLGTGASMAFRGGAGVRLAPMHRTLEGPGRIELDGAFTIRTANRTRSAPTFRFGPGPYRVELDWTAGQFHVAATVEGP